MPDQADASLQSKIFSACTGAIITSLLMTPFDVVKTRQQSKTLVRADPLLPAVKEWRATHLWVPRNARNLVDTALYTRLIADHKTTQSLVSKHRQLASLCVCSDMSLASKSAAETWRQLYHDINIQPQAIQPSASNVEGGTLSNMRHIARTEGLQRLWRGLSPTLVASGPSTVIYFVGYDYLRQWMGQQMLQTPLVAPYEKYASLLAGCLARTAAVTTISPIELVRTRMQSSAALDFTTVIRGISSEISTGGLSTLWRGLVPTLWRDVPFSALYWFGYERWKEAVYQPLLYTSQDELFSRLVVAFCSGASSGIVAATLTTPFDVAKTRRQIERHANPHSHIEQHKTLSQMLRYIWRTEGVRGLFAGLAPRLMKVAPSCAIMISSYELGKIVLAK